MRSINSKHLTLKQNPDAGFLTIVISKKVAQRAVDRNKLKRRIKEIVRIHIKQKTNQDMVVCGHIYTKKGVSELLFQGLKKEVEEILVKID